MNKSILSQKRPFLKQVFRNVFLNEKMKNFIRSRTGQLFFVIHLILFVICVVTLRGLSSVEEHESHYLSKVFFIITLFDYPTAKPLHTLANYFSIPYTNFRDLIIGLIVSFQWWIVGYIFELCINSVKKLVTKPAN